jgi:hypothetical protein
LKPANSPQDEFAAADLRRKWSTIPKAALSAFHNQPLRFTAWRLFVLRADRSLLFEIAASGMVNHDASHQLSGRRSSWVTACRVDGGVVMKGSRRRKLYHDRGIFAAQQEAIEKNCAVVAGLRRSPRFRT